MTLKRKIKKGFTLVELIVVIAVIAILAGVSVGAYFGITESAKASKLEQEAKQLYKTIQLVGSSNSDNHQLKIDGLHVVDLQVFEDALNEVSGTNYDVLTGDVSSLCGQAIILKEGSTSPLAGNATVYKSFEYFTPEVGNSAGVVSVVDGGYSKENREITVNELYTTADAVNKALETAKDNSDKTTVIKFGADIEFKDHCAIGGGNVILDLNGYQLSAVYENGVTHVEGDKTINQHDIIALHVFDGANVTLLGNGSIKVKSHCTCTNCEGGTVLIGVYDNSKLLIKNGSFCTGDEITCALYSRNSAEITIEGGEFSADIPFEDNGKYYTFNLKNTDNGEYKHFIVKGGTFHKNNPAKYVHDKNKEYNFVASGYESIETYEGSMIWKVTKTA